MARTPGRDATATRRLILDAAAGLVSSHGATATLDDIAHAAGVSKGGLLYHYASKDDLLVALATDQYEQFRASIDAATDPDDTAPGRLARAYVRASFAALPDDDSDQQRALVTSFALTAQLMTVPAIADLARAQARQLRVDLEADGLPPDTLTLIVAAADGASTGPLWGDQLPRAQRETLERQLIALTRGVEPRT